MSSFYDIAERMPQYKEAGQLQDIVELIAQCLNRIKEARTFCEEAYGLNENGRIKATNADIAYIEKYQAIAKRLKQYFNYKVTKITIYQSVIIKQ